MATSPHHNGSAHGEPTATAALIAALRLEPHVEGGYYRRSYESGAHTAVSGSRRPLMTSIYYLLTRRQPLGRMHRNRADIVHYFQLGDPLEYWLLHDNGRLERRVLGSRLHRGERLQLTVPGGTWKASRLLAGPAGYGLISEAVAPGFDYADMELGDADALAAAFPAKAGFLRRLCGQGQP